MTQRDEDLGFEMDDEPQTQPDDLREGTANENALNVDDGLYRITKEAPRSE